MHANFMRNWFWPARCPRATTTSSTSCATVFALLVALCAASLTQGATVTHIEYYIDKDPGQGNGTPIPADDGAYDGALESGEITVETNGLKPGPHMVYVRARSSTGAWGTYPPVLLYVYQRPTVAAAEYYIDSDPGLGKGTPLEAVDGDMGFVRELVTATLLIVGLSRGEHTLYVRARNSAGIWGTATAVPFEVLRPAIVSEAEYGLGGPTDLAPSGGTWAMEPVDFPFDSTVEDVRKGGVIAPSGVGCRRVFVRAKDSLGIWGEWAYADFEVAEEGYWIWAADHGLTGVDDDPTSDPDADSAANLVEYGSNMDPTASDDHIFVLDSGTSGAPCVALTDTGFAVRLRIEYIRRKGIPGLTYVVQFCSDLLGEGAAGWHPGDGTEEVFPIDGAWERVVVEDTVTGEQEPTRFGRVSLTYTICAPAPGQ